MVMVKITIEFLNDFKREPMSAMISRVPSVEEMLYGEGLAMRVSSVSHKLNPKNKDTVAIVRVRI